MIDGRYIHLDVAQPISHVPSRQSSRSSSFGGDHGPSSNTTVDGSKFQGGRYNKEGPGSFRRKESGGSFRRSESTGAAAPLPPGERPALKLQRRSQTEGAVPSSTSASSIFGGAKPRDQDSWERGRTNNVSAGGGDAKGGGGDRKPRNTSLGRGTVAGRGDGRDGSGRVRGEGRGRGESGGRGDRAGRDGGRGDRKSVV